MYIMLNKHTCSMYTGLMIFFHKIICKNKSNRIIFHSELAKDVNNSAIQGIEDTSIVF